MSMRLLALMMVTGILVFLAMTVHALCWAQDPRGDLQTGIAYNNNPYKVGPGDVLSMQVYNQTDLSQTEILVREDGMASFAAAGQVMVAGKTLEEITHLLRYRLSELYVDPIITLNVTQPRPGVVYLAGAVLKPGMYQLLTAQSKNSPQAQPITRLDLRLTNVLANAGGVMLNADLSRVQVRRASTGETLTVDLWQLLRQADSRQEVWLESGDSVYIPGRDYQTLQDAELKLLLASSLGPGTFTVRVIGHVTTPGLYDLNAVSPGLLSGVAKAGGFRVGADRKKIAIKRFLDHNTATILVVNSNMEDVVLRPNDVVFVAETRLTRTARYFESVGKILSPFASAATPLLIFR